MLTRKAKYGLRALLYLANEKPCTPVLISQISEDEDIPKKFLEAILLELRKNEILTSRRGKGGGYELNLPASQIYVGQVLRILDGPLAPVSCVSQNFYQKCDDCKDEQKCKVRLIMKKVRDSISDILDSISLSELSQMDTNDLLGQRTNSTTKVPAR